MRLIDGDALIQKRQQAGKFHPDMYVIGQVCVMDAPEIKPKEGRWKGNGMGDYRCSVCWHVIGGKTKYCSECGAKMD